MKSQETPSSSASLSTATGAAAIAATAPRQSVVLNPLSDPQQQQSSEEGNASTTSTQRNYNNMLASVSNAGTSQRKEVSKVWSSSVLSDRANQRDQEKQSRTIFSTDTFGLWYFDNTAEKEFIAHERQRCGTRFVVFISISVCAGTSTLLVLADETLVYVALLASAVVIQLASIVAELVLWFIQWRSKRFRRGGIVSSSEALHKATPLHGEEGQRGEEEEESTPKRSPAAVTAHNALNDATFDLDFSATEGAPGSVAQSSEHPRECTSSYVCESRTHKTDVTIARVHEAICTASIAASAVVTTLIFAHRQNHCDWFRHYDDEKRQTDVDCPDRLYQFVFFMACMPLVVGQPRLLFVIPILFTMFIMSVALVSLHNATLPARMFTFLVIFLGFSFVLLLKQFSENINRRRFEIQWWLTTHTNEVSRRADALAKFMLSITPPYLHHRLCHPTDSATMVHSSTRGLCLVVELRNVAQFMTSMLPTMSAGALARVHHNLFKESAACNYHHIRIVGDTSYFVSNLFQSDSDSAAKGALQGVNFALRHVIKGVPEGIEPSVGLACGSLVGMPLGNNCVRYDLFGPALTAAQNLAVSLPGGVLQVSRSIDTMLAGCLVQSVSPMQSGTSANGCTQSATDLLVGTANTDEIEECGEEEDTTTAVVVIAIIEDAADALLASLCERQQQKSASLLSNLNTTATETGAELVVPPEDATTHLRGMYEQHLLRTTTATGGVDDPAAAATAKVAAQPVVSSEELLAERRGCLCMDGAFINPHTSEAAQRMYKKHHRMSFVLVNAFFFLFLIVLVVLGVTNRIGSWDDAMNVFIACEMFASIGHGAIAVRGFISSVDSGDDEHENFVVTINDDADDNANDDKNSSSNQQQPTALLHAVMSLCACLGLAGANFARPSIVGDNCAYLLYLYAFSWVYSGAPLRNTTSTFLLLTILLYTLLFAFRPMMENVALLTVLAMIVPSAMAFMYRSSERRMFIQTAKNDAILLEIQEHDRLREIVFSALIPREVRWRVTRESTEFECIDIWISNDCLVMTIIMSPEEIGGGEQQQHTGTGTGENSKTGGGSWCSISSRATHTALGSASRENSSSANFSSSARQEQQQQPMDLRRLKKCSDESIGKLEAAVAGCPNQSLDIIRVFGGTVIIAGPLDPGHKPPSNNNSSSSQHHQPGNLVTCTQDMIHIVETLLAQKLRFTCGVTCEQAINVLRQSEFPSYDLMGVAVNMSRSMTLAAPVVMVVLTERLAQVYLRECVPVSPRLVFSPAESWRLRDVGSVRVQRVSIAQQHDGNSCSNTAASSSSLRL